MILPGAFTVVGLALVAAGFFGCLFTFTRLESKFIYWWLAMGIGVGLFVVGGILKIIGAS